MIAFAMLGAIIASFIGVVVARIYTGQSIFTGRSRCDACDTPLPPAALVPILSFVASKGRAHCCGAQISGISPLSELVLGALFAFSYAMLGLTPTLPFMFAALSLLLALVLYDLEHHILPSPLLYAFLGISAAVGFLASADSADFLHTALVAALIGLSLFAIYAISGGRAMGFADAPLALALALLTGPLALSGFIYSFWIGAVVGIVLLLRRPNGSRMGIEVPFAPFLACGFLLAYVTQWNLFTLILLSAR